MITKSGKSSVEETVKDILAKIKKTTAIREDFKKKSGSVAVVEHPDDMYLIEYKKEGLEHRNYVILHGKCKNAGLKQILDWEYKIQVVTHFLHTDKTYSRTRCAHCKQELDPTTAKKIRESQKIKLAEERLAYSEWLEEQILLGKK